MSPDSRVSISLRFTGDLVPRLRRIAADPGPGAIAFTMELRLIPHPPGLIDRLRRALAAVPPALDAAARDPERFGVRVERLLDGARRTAEWAHIDGERPLGRAGEAAVDSYEEQLGSRARGSNGQLHLVTLGLAVHHRKRQRGRPSGAGLERAVVALQGFLAAHPALRPHLAGLESMLREDLVSFAPKAKR